MNDWRLLAVIGALWGSVALWRWRRRVTRVGDESNRLGHQVVELLREILAELRRR